MICLKTTKTKKAFFKAFCLGMQMSLKTKRKNQSQKRKLKKWDRMKNKKLSKN